MISDSLMGRLSLNKSSIDLTLPSLTNLPTHVLGCQASATDSVLIGQGVTKPFKKIYTTQVIDE